MTVNRDIGGHYDRWQNRVSGPAANRVLDPLNTVVESNHECHQHQLEIGPVQRHIRPQEPAVQTDADLKGGAEFDLPFSGFAISADILLPAYGAVCNSPETPLNPRCNANCCHLRVLPSNPDWIR